MGGILEHFTECTLQHADLIFYFIRGNYLPWWLSGKESTCNVGDMGWIPGSGRSLGGGNSNPLLLPENPMDRGA